MRSKEEINRTIGVRTAALCLHFGIKSAELAAVLGVSVSQTNKKLAGTAGMTAAELVNVAAKIGVTTAVITNEEKFGEAVR
jgi:plasmid maintenance system antidote protein VapI